MKTHEKLRNRIKSLRLSKSKISKEMGISRPTFDKYLISGTFCDVGHRTPHGLTDKQKAIVKKYL